VPAAIFAAVFNGKLHLTVVINQVSFTDLSDNGKLEAKQEASHKGKKAEKQLALC